MKTRRRREERSESAPRTEQRYKQIRSTTFPTYEEADDARYRESEPEWVKVRRRADGTFDVVTYAAVLG